MLRLAGRDKIGVFSARFAGLNKIMSRLAIVQFGEAPE
jgi:hypothetical protein